MKPPAKKRRRLLRARRMAQPPARTNALGIAISRNASTTRKRGLLVNRRSLGNEAERALGPRSDLRHHRRTNRGRDSLPLPASSAGAAIVGLASPGSSATEPENPVETRDDREPVPNAPCEGVVDRLVGCCESEQAERSECQQQETEEEPHGHRRTGGGRRPHARPPSADPTMIRGSREPCSLRCPPLPTLACAGEDTGA